MFLNLRERAVVKLGGRCQECGSDNLRRLLLHHANHDGNEHRKSSSESIRHLRILDGLDSELYVVLCRACHAARHRTINPKMLKRLSSVIKEASRPLTVGPRELTVAIMKVI